MIVYDIIKVGDIFDSTFYKIIYPREFCLNENGSFYVNVHDIGKWYPSYKIIIYDDVPENNYKLSVIFRDIDKRYNFFIESNLVKGNPAYLSDKCIRYILKYITYQLWMDMYDKEKITRRIIKYINGI